MTDKNSILLAIITAEHARYYEYYDSLDMLILPPNTSKIHVHTSSPAQNRNLIIRKALQESFTHIMFTDDDQVFEPNTINQLLSRDVDIVSGLYCMKCPPFPPLAFDRFDEKGFAGFADLTGRAPELLEVVACPAGALLVKTDVFRNIPEPWFTLGQIHPDSWGDDIWFCGLARNAGYKIYVDTSVTVGHITKCILTPVWNGREWTIGYQINNDFAIDQKQV
jgi:hypothetical protein